MWWLLARSTTKATSRTRRLHSILGMIMHFIQNPFTDETATTKPEMVKTPSEEQKEEALAAALKAGYSKPVFSQILNYGMDLNVRILEYDQTPCDLGL